MEFVNNIFLGFSVAGTVSNLLYCLLGVFVGTIVGVLPGVGSLAAMSMLLPLLYLISDPITAIIFLAVIYYGTQYGGSTTSILMNMPGEVSSVMTTIDGYQMTKQGRAGSALAIAAISSFFAGTIATVLIAGIGAPLADIAFMFTPADYASLLALGLAASVMLARGGFLRNLGMVMLGLLLGTVGVDPNSGTERFTFDIPYLYDGINFIIVAMGVFGLGEMLYNTIHVRSTKVTIPKIKDLYPSKEELKRSVWPTLRGTTTGSILGLLPGAGGIMSSFVGYLVEKRLSKNKHQLGKGAIEGVAGPESANNAGAQTSFVPMLSLGLPTTPVMALMIGVLILNDIQPGPMVISSNPSLFWGLVASMWIGNLMLLILNLPLVGLWVRLLTIPRYVLYPLMLVACMVGAYFINYQYTDILFLLIFALLGYTLKVLDCEPAPLAMGFVIGTMFEEYLRRALSVSQGDWMIFLQKPISLTFLLILVILLFVGLFFRRKI